MELIKVKREGGKGYRLISREKFDQGGHEAFDAPVVEAQEVPAPEVEAPKRRGRPPKARA